MARKIGRVVASTGEYETSDGETKKRWKDCGIVIENQGRLSLKMEAFPVGPEWSGWFSIFLDDGIEIAVQGQAQQRPKQSRGRPSRNYEDDEVPF